jgi:hypothetical protein
VALASCVLSACGANPSGDPATGDAGNEKGPVIQSRGPKKSMGDSHGICEFAASGKLIVILVSSCPTESPLDLMVHQYRGDERVSAKLLEPKPSVALPKDKELQVELELPRFAEGATRLKLGIEASCDDKANRAYGSYQCLLP